MMKRKCLLQCLIVAAICCTPAVAMADAWYIEGEAIKEMNTVSVTVDGSDSVYDLTIHSNDITIKVPQDEFVTKNGSRVTVPYEMEGTDIRNATHFAVVVTDKNYTDPDAKILQKDRMTFSNKNKLDTRPYSSGSGYFTLGKNVSGTWGEDYHVYIVAENEFSEIFFVSVPLEIKGVLEYPKYNDFVYKYDVYGSQCVSIVGYDGDEKDIVIPEEIAGLPVKKIDKDAFLDYSRLETIRLPENLEFIGSYAFKDCVNLLQIDIPKSVSCISYAAFDGCSSLNAVTFHENEGLMYDAEENAYVPFVLSIDGVAFRDTKLDNLYLPSRVGMLGWNIISDTNIKEIVIPKCPMLYADGSLFDDAIVERIIFEDGREIIPEWICSCSGEQDRESTTIKEVVIPNSVKTIGDGAFYRCRMLTDIYYAGSQDEWKAIDILEDNEDLKKATIHYNYTDSIEPARDVDRLMVESFLSNLYDNFLGREADSSGLQAWSDVLVEGKATGSKVVYKFVYSDEFQANPLSNKDFVTAMYETIFDRDPDDAGFNAWVNVLEKGCTRKKVLAGFLNSDEMEELCDDMGIEAGSYHSDEIVC